jgi:hypothetical protein
MSPELKAKLDEIWDDMAKGRITKQEGERRANAAGWAPTAGTQAPRIVMAGGKLSAIVDQAETALLASGIPIYQRGGMLTHPVRLDTRVGEAGNVRREAGSTVLVAVREAWLTATHRRVVADATVDAKLTAEGKAAAIQKSQATTREAISAWHEQRLRELDADLLAKRAALIGTADRPDAKRVDTMAANMLKHTPTDIAVFYNSATDAERREMEAASASVGRVPLKTDDGLKWQTLLDSATVTEAQLARAEQTNPAAAQRVRELSEIRDMQVTLTGVALSEI